ncbi:MAG: Holliday junction branch migration protein RuvA [Chlamydiales bacterium]|nr:Holliday junction branch migration protein RuvA [Chlamydiales bacterium]
MFDYIQGVLVEIASDYVVLDAHGIGYKVFIPSGQYNMHADIGNDIKLFVSPVYREDSQKLFGFLSKKERELFIKLEEVSGIGPKTALSLLSHHSFDDLICYIQTSNAKLLATTPGIGKKTSEKLIIDLKDKIIHLKAEFSMQHHALTAHPDIANDGMQALINLGYSAHQAKTAVMSALQKEKTNNLSSLIALALKNI